MNETLDNKQNEDLQESEVQDNVEQNENDPVQTEESPVPEEAQGNEEQDQLKNQEDDEYVKHVQNWRALREKADKAEKERDELLARINKEKENSVPENSLQGHKSQEGNQKREQFSLNDDDLMEGKHLKYYQQQNEQRIAELEARLIENQIKSNFPDFDDVVNKDTLGMLRDADPELAESLAANPNIYSKAVAAYKSIKRYGLAESTYQRDKEKVNKNIAKPRTVTSLSPQQGDSPLSKANAFAQEFTEEDKEREYRIMQEIIRNG